MVRPQSVRDQGSATRLRDQGSATMAPRPRPQPRLQPGLWGAGAATTPAGLTSVALTLLACCTAEHHQQKKLRGGQALGLHLPFCEVALTWQTSSLVT